MPHSIKPNKNLLMVFLVTFVFCSAFFLIQPVFSQEIIQGPNPQSSEALFNPNTHQTFILNRDNNVILVSDPAEKKIIARIPTGGQGSAIITTDDDGNFYVKNFISSDISVFPGLFLRSDFNKETVSEIIKERKIIPVAGNPVNITIDTELKRLHVFSSVEGVLSTIDTQIFEVIATKTLEPGPGRIIVNSDTQKLYVIIAGKNKLYIIDENTNETLNTLSFEKNLYNVSINGVDNNVLLPANHGGGIYVVDGETNELALIIEEGGESPRYLAVDVFNKKIYVINYIIAQPYHETLLSVIDAETYQLIEDNILPHTGLHPKDFSIDFKNNLIYVPDARNSRVFIFDSNTYEMVTSLKTGTNPGKPLIFPQSGNVIIPNIADDTTTVITETAEGELQAQTFTRRSFPEPTRQEKITDFLTSKIFYIPTSIVLLLVIIYFAYRYSWIKRFIK